MKKLWKKLVAVTTAVMMAVTLLPAMANAETTIDYNRKGSITINKTTNVEKKNTDGTSNEYEPLKDAEFTLYKIASLDKNGYTMLVKDVAGYTEADSLLNLSKDEQKTVASQFANSTQTKANKIGTQVTDDKGQVNFTELGLGYYLVVETNAPKGYVASVPFFVAVPTSNTADDSNKNPENTQATSWVYDITARPKNESVSIDKKIVESGKGKDATQAGVGETVTYEITSISPKYTQEYFTENGAEKDPTYTIHDTLSAGLTYNKNLAVTVDGAELKNTNTDVYYNVAGETDRGFSIAFTKKFLQTEKYKGKSVKVTYTATVNKNAVVGTDGNTNTVTLDYNRTPGSNTTSATGTTTPKVYTYGLKLTKKDGKDNNTVLTGAEFKIYKVVDGTETQITNLDGMTDGIYTTSSAGKITIKGLNAGTYKLEEVKAPRGYTLLKDKIEFTITGAEPANGTVTTTTNGFKAEGDGYVSTTVTNNQGFNLPSTGGMGTYIFTIAGLVIMAGAAFLLIASKKRRA